VFPKLLGKKFANNFQVHSAFKNVNPKHQIHHSLSAAQWIELKRLDAPGELLGILAAAAQSKSF
jgi:hypothetical protein